MTGGSYKCGGGCSYNLTYTLSFSKDALSPNYKSVCKVLKTGIIITIFKQLKFGMETYFNPTRIKKIIPK